MAWACNSYQRLDWSTLSPGHARSHAPTSAAPAMLWVMLLKFWLASQLPYCGFLAMVHRGVFGRAELLRGRCPLRGWYGSRYSFA